MLSFVDPGSPATLARPGPGLQGFGALRPKSLPTQNSENAAQGRPKQHFLSLLNGEKYTERSERLFHRRRLILADHMIRSKSAPPRETPLTRTSRRWRLPRRSDLLSFVDPGSPATLARPGPGLQGFGALRPKSLPTQNSENAAQGRPKQHFLSLLNGEKYTERSERLFHRRRLILADHMIRSKSAPPRSVAISPTELFGKKSLGFASVYFSPALECQIRP